jgi:hypothetical protein
LPGGNTIGETFGRARAGPGGIEPKYFSTSCLATAGSKSPAMTSDRLFGV